MCSCCLCVFSDLASTCPNKTHRVSLCCNLRMGHYDPARDPEQGREREDRLVAQRTTFNSSAEWGLLLHVLALHLSSPGSQQNTMCAPGSSRPGKCLHWQMPARPRGHLPAELEVGVLSMASRTGAELSTKIHLLTSDPVDQEPVGSGLPLPSNTAAVQAQPSPGRHLCTASQRKSVLFHLLPRTR